MKRVTIFTSVLFFIIAGFSSAVFAQGSVYRAGDMIRIPAPDSLDRQLMAAGEWIDISGVLANDLFAAGSNISIDGTIDDDAFLAGDNISIKGTIRDMLAAAAGNLILDGEIGGDLFAAAQSLHFLGNSRVGGNIYAAGEKIIVDERAVLEGYSRLAAKSIYLDGHFRDHVVIYSNDITFGPGYYSDGDTKIISSQSIYRDNLGVIPERLTIELRQPPILPVIFLQIWFYLGLLVIGCLLLYLFRPVAVDLQRFASERFWKNTGIGVLVILLVPLALFLLLFPIITIPLVLFLGVLYLIVLFLSYLAVALILGVQLMRWFKKEISPAAWYGSLAIGLIIIAILNNLPFLGPVFNLFLLFFGVGSFTSYLAMRYRNRTVYNA